ncbi:helix-turn-helix domain-containing protein [Microbacteriaceae bacterium 4G12]
MGGEPERETAPGVVADSAHLGWENVTVREVVDPHEHELSSPPLVSLQLVLVTAGSYLIESARPRGRWEQALMAPGLAAATPPGRDIRAAWRSRSTDTFTSLHVAVSAPILDSALGAYPNSSSGHLDFLARGDEFVRAGMLELARAARAGAPALLADTVSMSIVAHLLSLPVPTARRPDGGLSRAQLPVVIEHMTAHLADPLTLTELAALVHMSTYHFLRRFSASTGVSPMRYLTGLRMQRGRELLTGGDFPIAAVATACGYGTAAAFTAAFRRHHDVSPRVYRSQRS